MTTNAMTTTSAMTTSNLFNNFASAGPDWKRASSSCKSSRPAADPGAGKMFGSTGAGAHGSKPAILGLGAGLPHARARPPQRFVRRSFTEELPWRNCAGDLQIISLCVCARVCVPSRPQPPLTSCSCAHRSMLRHGQGTCMSSSGYLAKARRLTCKMHTIVHQKM
eukprot:SAG11_NODE_10087_length_856_cov_1.834875_2_plen_164_part_01